VYHLQPDIKYIVIFLLTKTAEINIKNMSDVEKLQFFKQTKISNLMSENLEKKY